MSTYFTRLTIMVEDPCHTPQICYYVYVPNHVKDLESFTGDLISLLQLLLSSPLVSKYYMGEIKNRTG